MSAQSAIRNVIGKYGRLTRKLEESFSAEPFDGSMKAVSGEYFSRALHEAVVGHLLKSLDLEVNGDSLRLLLAYEYWRAGRLDDAIREYRRIVANDFMQASVAGRMIEQIRQQRGA